MILNNNNKNNTKFISDQIKKKIYIYIFLVINKFIQSCIYKVQRLIVLPELKFLVDKGLVLSWFE